MRNKTNRLPVLALLAWLSCLSLNGWAQEAPPAPPEAPNEAQTEQPATAPDIDVHIDVERDDSAPEEDTDREDRRRRHRQDIVRLGDDARLSSDEVADNVISVFGSSTSEGEVNEGVVSVFGDTRVTGPAHDVVTVFGNGYVNSRVYGDVVTAFGNLELGPEADISGEVVTVGGTLTRDPAAFVGGSIEEVSFGGDFLQLRWLRPWIEECLVLFRPLAPVEGIEWAWWLAAGFLGLYILLALMFSAPVERCVRTLEEHPGESTLTSLISVFLVPVVFMLLMITIIGIVLVPFFALALFLAGLFGKTVVLAAIGRRLTRFAEGGVLAHVAFATLIGGLIVTAIYMVPFLGFIAYNLTGILGFGVIVYTSMLALRAHRDRPIAVAPDGTPINAQSNEAFEPATIDTSAPPIATTAPEIPITSLPRADFWIRMGALLIDAILVAIIANLIPGSGDIWLLALATYGALMWKLKGTTVGGIICNLRVVRLDGRELDWATAIVRALGCFLSLFVVLLGFIWIIFDPERQAWHDKIAGTIVVRASKTKGLV